MSKTADFDVVIVGSGVAGLVCGCYLQKAGLKVAIVEAREEAGGGRMAHEAMRPGYLVHSCVWGEQDQMMMHQLNLELDRYGYQENETSSDWGWLTLFENETALINHCFDYRKTAEKVKRFSERDARKVLEIGEYMEGPYDDKTPRGAKFTELIWTEPWTWENFDKLVNLVAPVLPFADPYEMTDLNAFEILNLMFESDQMKVFSSYLGLAEGFYPFHTGGAGAIGMFFSLGGFFCHPKHGNHSVAHVYIRCFRALGGKLFNSCPVKKIIVAGGEAKGVILDDHAAFPGKEITAKMVITNLNPRLTFTELVDEEHVGKKVIQQIKTNWKTEAVLVVINFAVKERPHFAAEKFDSDISYAMAGVMGSQTLKDIVHCHGERVAGMIAENPTLTFGIPAKDDPTQARADNSIIYLCFEVPYAVYEKGGEQIWDDEDFRRMITEKIIGVMEAHSPGFRENIIDYWMTTPLDLQRLNPNYRKGCFFGGSLAAHQMFYGNRANFEGFDKGGIVTPIKNLYGAGGVGPADTSAGNGYRAACHVAESLGLRNQPWWTHRAFEYVARKYVFKNYVPLKSTSILDG